MLTFYQSFLPFHPFINNQFPQLRTLNLNQTITDYLNLERMDQGLISQLTELEKNQLQKIVKSFPTTVTLIDRTVTYYLQFKTNVGSVPSQQILLAMKCAFFMAQKSQVMDNLKGQKIRGIGLSLNNLIKSHQNDKVIVMLKEFSKKGIIKDHQVATQVKNVVEQINLLIQFSAKFQKTISKLELKLKNSNPNYETIFLSLAWLVFVSAKDSIFTNSQQIVENTCLLSHVISFMIIHGWNFIKAEFLFKGDDRLNENSSLKQVSISVKNKLFDFFKITNLTFYENVALEFQNFFNDKIQRGIIKHSSNSHFLSPQLIEVNYKKLDQWYNKNMSINSLDHRIFYKERTAIMTPSRFTPFAKQGYLNKGLLKGKLGLLNPTQKGKDNFTSHRVLTYQFDRMQNIDSKNPTYNEITKFPKNIIHSPSTTNIPLIQTPVGAAMQMYGYLNTKSGRYNEKAKLQQKDYSILGYIDKFFTKQKKAKAIEDIKKKLVFSLWKTYLAEFTEAFPKEVTPQIQQALLALIIQMVCFVNNIHIEFFEIQSQLELSVYSEWRVCDFLLKNDRAMPITLKAHILDLQVSFVTERIWLQDQIVTEIQKFFKSQKADSPLKRKVQNLCKRIIFQCAFQINQISNYLKVSEDFSQKTFQVLKNILQQHIQIYKNRFMDQLILCAFFLVAKIEKTTYTLGQIKQAYIEMNPHNVKEHQKLLVVNTPELQEAQSLNLVQFYNKLFLQYAKVCLKIQKNQQNIEINHSHIKDTNQAKMLLQSPLKQIIPRETNALNKNFEGNQTAKNKPKSHLTPQLYAYTESPLLRNQLNAFNVNKAPNNSRKVLDYEKQEAKIMQKCNNKENTQVPENANVDEFFNKKFKQPSFTQKANIQNISPRNLTNPQSRANSFVDPKPGISKTGLFGNLQNQNTYHLNIK